MPLQGGVVSPSALTDTDLRRMFDLMTAYYDGMDRARFQDDLAEKERVVLLWDESRTIRGFSTLMTLDAGRFRRNGGERPVRLVFSGDTVVEKRYWGNLQLPRVWGQYVIRRLPEAYPDADLYWVLTAKGHRTYGIIARYFIDFFPRRDRETPALEWRIIEQFGAGRYPARFDAKTGVIRSDGRCDRVRPGVAPLSRRDRNDPDIAFFFERNPGYGVGDELVCVARAAMNNLTPGIQRIFRRWDAPSPI